MTGSEGVSLVAQTIKTLPAMQETQVQSLGGEDPPGEGNVNPLQYSCLEKSHGQRSLVGCSAWGCKELDTTWPPNMQAQLIISECNPAFTN